MILLILEQAAELPTVRIFQFSGPLHFANTDYFRHQLISVTSLDPDSLANIKSLLQRQQLSEPDLTTQSNKVR